MKKTLSVSAAALLLAACGGSNLDPNTVRGALPAADSVQIGTPAASSSASAKALVAPGTIAQPSQVPGGAPPYTPSLAVMSYWTAVTVNVGVWWTLTLVDVITAFPPASCNATSCTWGPWLDNQTQNQWKLVVQKNGSAYDYVLSGESAATQGNFLPVISGTAYPGPDRYHGNGALTLDFDAGKKLNPSSNDSGKLDVIYDNRTGVSIGATLTNGKNGDPANPYPMNAVYQFDGTNGSGGVMQVAFENLTTTEQFSIRTRWNATGAGRSDAQYVAAGGGLTVETSQCWDGAPTFPVTYDGAQIPPTGDSALCVFTPALYADVVLP
jgi:hypothetical protein